MSYNLDQEADKEYFEFELKGHRYKMQYPTTEELENFQTMKLPNGDPDVAAMNKHVYAFVSSDDENAPAFEEAMKGVRIPVLREFREMINVEFGLKD